MAMPSGIQGQILEITVIGCYKLRDTEWISRQDPYVCLEYANTKYRTRTCTDGGKNPTFNEKFVFPLIEGLREITLHVWNSNTLSQDDFIGSGKVLLQKALSQGYDDSNWSIQTRSGRYGGEVRVIMHYAGAGAQKPSKGVTAAPPPYPTGAYAPPSPYPASPYPYGAPPPSGYQPAPYPYPPYPTPPPATYPPPAYCPNPYPPQPSVYPPSPYPPPTYPPSQSPYPYPPAGPGIYPPPPY